MAEADKDGNGKLDYEEFVKMLMSYWYFVNIYYAQVYKPFVFYDQQKKCFFLIPGSTISLYIRVATNSEYGPNTKYRIPNIFVFENLTNTE